MLLYGFPKMTRSGFDILTQHCYNRFRSLSISIFEQKFSLCFICSKLLYQYLEILILKIGIFSTYLVYGLLKSVIFTNIRSCSEIQSLEWKDFSSMLIIIRTNNCLFLSFLIIILLINEVDSWLFDTYFFPLHNQLPKTLLYKLKLTVSLVLIAHRFIN